VADQNAGLRERRAAVGFVLEVLDAAARAEGFACYRDSDWSPDVGDIIDRLAAALAPTERERALLNEIAARAEVQARLIAERDAAERAALAPTERERALEAALRVLAAFVRTAPGRLPQRVQDAADAVPWESPAALLSAPPAPTEEAP
jgi:hypothetical protein